MYTVLHEGYHIWYWTLLIQVSSSVYLGRVLKLSKVSLIIKVVIRIKFNIIFSLIE